VLVRNPVEKRLRETHGRDLSYRDRPGNVSVKSSSPAWANSGMLPDAEPAQSLARQRSKDSKPPGDCLLPVWHRFTFCSSIYTHALRQNPRSTVQPTEAHSPDFDRSVSGGSALLDVYPCSPSDEI